MSEVLPPKTKLGRGHNLRLALALSGALIGFFVQDFNQQLIQTILPYYSRLMPSLEGHYDLANSVLYSVWALSSMLSNPLVGWVADTHSRVTGLVICFIGMAASSLLSAFTTTFVGLVATRIISGVSAACFSTLTAIILDHTPPRQRSFMMSVGGLFYGLAYVFGSQLSKHIVSYLGNSITRAWMPVCIISAVTALVGGAVSIALVMLGPSRTDEKPKQTRRGRLHNYISLLATPRLLLLYGVFLTLFMSLAGLPAMVPYYIQDHYHLTEEESTRTFASIFTLVGLGLSVVALLVKPLHWILRRDAFLLVFGTVMCWAPLFLTPVAPVGLFPWIMFLNASGQSFASAPMTAMLGQFGSVDERAFVTGFSGVFQALARVITPIVSGQLYDMTGGLNHLPPWILIIGLGMVSTGLAVVYSVTDIVAAQGRKKSADVSEETRALLSVDNSAINSESEDALTA